ncbi:hypothetical protein DYI25_15040 [Mesobacillus boroniphilus]|uniref:Uncharacterized protein n=1 Tax=Mesobacillus boroniphilus TaxID=308892 RepID=A0A944CMH8_9BACI|nr:hypothetical protein [Mesobacillus boroniphilus]MBS8265740.1 hypothetical protein [Mesobacillus boroniphilus]
MRRNKPILSPVILILLSAVGLALVVFKLLISFGGSAANTVEEFYSYEQKNNYSSSWELFHPYMKERFPKPAFIQDRSHVFIGHFGADSFDFTVSDGKEIKNWRPAKGEKPFNTAVKFLVTQTYNGKYGKFSFVQEVYVVKHQKEWTIIWNYNK